MSINALTSPFVLLSTSAVDKHTHTHTPVVST